LGSILEPGLEARRVLVPHPDCSPPDLDIAVKLSVPECDVLKLEYILTGDIESVALPPLEIPGRTDNLWEHSCFEAFVALSGNAYLELNFAPSRLWASYVFSNYREGMASAEDVRRPDIFIEKGGSQYFMLTAFIDLSQLPIGISLASPLALGLSAVIENNDGQKSYWALSHPQGKADFHHRDCFALQLGAAGAA
jgi:hypothetical protein